MSSAVRKRRASDMPGTDASRRRTQTQRPNGESSTQGARRNRRVADSEDEESAEEDDNHEDVDADLEGATQGATNIARLTKDLIRFVLASEFSRTPIRRSDITSKVLQQHGRLFKEVFAAAQDQLQKVFGMQLVELPMREKTKLAQRRAATAATDKAASTSKAYILVSTLPAEYRDAGIIQPFGFREQSYTGLVTFIVALIYLNGRSLPANALNRYLRRMHADEFTPVDTTERLLQLMTKHGYLVRIKDTSGEMTSFEYHVGPRAKVEIGEAGVLEMVKAVYGPDVPEDVEVMVKSNMGPDPMEVRAAEEEGEDGGARREKRAAPRRTRRRAAEEEDEDGDYE